VILSTGIAYALDTVASVGIGGHDTHIPIFPLDLSVIVSETRMAVGQPAVSLPSDIRLDPSESDGSENPQDLPSMRHPSELTGR
jgi:hypothetical protein